MKIKIYGMKVGMEWSHLIPLVRVWSYQTR